ncbi:DUF3833 family protein [Sphingomonas arenae]|nr:DUF3833 family protein [Sphingomonas arenae]
MVLLALVPLSGCATAVLLPADSGSEFSPIDFFENSSRGVGTFHRVFAAPARLEVASTGTRRPNGELVLTQRIRQGGDAPRTRTWTIRPVGPNRYTGTLTEAVGPVHITTDGPRASVHYAMKDGLTVRQQLALQSDGTLLNHLEVRKWGLRVARVNERIRKLP